MPPQHNGSEELPAVPAQSRGLALRLADSGCMETCRCEPRGWASEHKLGRAPRELTEKAAALCCDLQAQASSLPGAAWLVGEGLSHTAPVTGLVILFYNSPQGTSLGAGAQPHAPATAGRGMGAPGLCQSNPACSRAATRSGEPAPRSQSEHRFPRGWDQEYKQVPVLSLPPPPPGADQKRS